MSRGQKEKKRNISDTNSIFLIVFCTMPIQSYNSMTFILFYVKSASNRPITGVGVNEKK